MMGVAFTNPWTESEPTDATYVREVDDWIRRLATAVRERLAVEHFVYDVESGQPNIGKHRPGSAKIASGVGTAKPSPDPSAPGTVYYETDAKRLVYDTGTAWAVLAHNETHKAGGADPITPADIGAVAKDGDTVSGDFTFDDPDNSGRRLKHKYGATTVDLIVLYNALVQVMKTLELTVPGDGIILKTPDGTKRFKVTVNDSGDLVTTQV